MYNGNYEVASLVYIMYMYVQKRYFPLWYALVRFLCLIPLLLIWFLDMSNVDESPAIFETITSTVFYRLEVT